MKTMKLFAKALPLCAAALLAGCSDAAVDDLPAAAEGGGCTFTASIENDDTRATVSEEQNFLVTWSRGDAISFFHCGEAANLKSNYRGEEGSSYGEFEIEGLDRVLTQEGAYHIGVYPYAADNTFGNGAAGIVLPAEQCYRTGSFGGLNVFMTAFSPASEHYTFNFQSCHGAVGLQLRGNATIGSVRLTALPVEGSTFAGKLSGPATISVPYETEPVIEVGEVGEGERTVTLRCDGGIALSEERTTPLCIALLPDSYKLQFEIFDTSGRLLAQKTSKTVDIRRRRILMMKEFGVEALPDETEATDLSPEGTANCYVITPAMGAGTYSFDASVMGNGEAGMQFTYASELLPSITLDDGAAAELLWQDYFDAAKGEGLVTGVAYDASTKRITVTTGSTYHVGNAVVALKDAAGKILWSWHLWFADPKPAGLTSIYALFADPLDMNLGATVNTPDDLTNSAGLLYQWGRKDPIIGVGPRANLEVEKTKTSRKSGLYEVNTKKTLFTLSRETYDIAGNLIPMSNTQQTKLGTAGWSTYTTSGSIAFSQSIQYPMTILVCTHTYSDYGWFYDSSKATYLWGINYVGTTTIGKQHITKSILDPCPYGYKVPDTSELTFTGKATRGDYGYIFKGSTGEIYIPAAGYRDGQNSSYLGGLILCQSTSNYNLVGGCWYARHHSTNNKQGYNINIRWHHSYPGNSSYNQCLTNAGYKKAYALPVRCVKTSNIE